MPIRFAREIPLRHIRRLAFPAFLTFLAPALLLLSGCGGGSSTTQPSGPDSTSYADQFDYLWNTFDQQYSYFVYKNIDWNALHDTYRPQAIQATTQDQFNQVVTLMLANLHDLHVNLIDPEGNYHPTFTDTNFVNFDSGVWQQYLQSKGTNIQQNGYSTIGELGGVAYIAIPSWQSSSGGQASELDGVLNQFEGASSLIIDIRMNGGGDGTTAATFAGRFASQSTIGGYDKFRDGPDHDDFGQLNSRTVSPRGPWQFTSPVLLLIGRGCYSSNEDFIAMMCELPNVTVIGDTSGGHSGYPVVFTMASGWQFTVSTWIDYTAEMKGIEDRGIDPAVFVAVSAADFQAGKDPVLDYAIAHAP